LRHLFFVLTLVLMTLEANLTSEFAFPNDNCSLLEWIIQPIGFIG
jgi:hypothetical protein